jgi:4-amino-4-deoxy-L-arabinose transferase-like glycosyltransferase
MIRQWRVPIGWMLAATALWLTGEAIDRRTDIVIENLGDHLRFEVAGTAIEVPETIRLVRRITVTVSDSVDPPSGRRIELSHDGRVLDLPLAGRFPTKSSGHAPIADWWVDERASRSTIAEHEVEINGSFSLAMRLRGRFVTDATITVHGEPTTGFTFRRGLLDNYLLIWRGDGSLTEATSIDPTPVADILAIAAQLARILSAACLVIALVVAATTKPGRGQNPDASERCHGSHQRPSGSIALAGTLALACIGAVLSAWMASDVLGGLPHQIDETVYLIQARWLLDGEIAPPASAIWQHQEVPFTHHRDGRWLSHYTVGWPACLAVGLAAGTPVAVNLLLGGVLVVLVFLLGRELDDRLTGITAAALMTVSPVARVLSGSYFSHVACAVLVVVALWSAVLADRRSNPWFGAGVGIAMGACLAVRPMTAVIVSLVLGSWLATRTALGARRRLGWSGLAVATVTGLAASLPTLAHNAAVTGNPLSLPYSLARSPMWDPANIPFGLRNLDAILVSIAPNLFAWGWPVLTSGFVLALPLAFVCVPFLLRRHRPEDLLLVAILVAVAVGHLPTKANGLHGYGARYVFDVAACLFILTARGFRELGRAAAAVRWLARGVATVAAALVLSVAAVLPGRLQLYRGYDTVTGQLEQQIVATGEDRMVVLVEPKRWWPWAEGARLITGPRRHEIILALDLEDHSALAKAYPDWPVFRWDGRHRQLEQAGFR